MTTEQCFVCNIRRLAAAGFDEDDKRTDLCKYHEQVAKAGYIGIFDSMGDMIIIHRSMWNMYFIGEQPEADLIRINSDIFEGLKKLGNIPQETRQ